jgi:hypothetical protein
MNALLPRAILTWVLFVPVAIANGTVRETLYASYVGDRTAHQISTAIAIVAYFALAYANLVVDRCALGGHDHRIRVRLWPLCGWGAMERASR